MVLKRYKVREAFGMPHLPPAAEITGWEPGLPNVPEVDPCYVFEEDTLRQMNMFWSSGNRALLLEGDPAAGKTSLVEQFHARLGVPLYKVACSPCTETWQLFGQLLPRLDGQGLRWQDGPVTRACREGTSCLLDECNTLDPGVATGLNMILEGYSWTIPETGEVIRPAKTTRFFGTQNAVDSKAVVAGRNVQDVAFEDRWSFMRVDYVRPEVEKELIRRNLTKAGIPDEVAGQTANVVVTVGNRVRDAFRDDAPGIDKPLSTRVLLRWAKYTVMYAAPMRAKGKSPVHYAVRQAVRMSPTMTAAVEELITAVAGFDADLNQPSTRP